MWIKIPIENKDDYIAHHGILGQKWGKKNGPPYPLDSSVSTGKSLKKEGKLPKNAKHQNLDKWGKSSKTNILYISGSSGSGKSTVANSLKDDKTEIIHLDSFFDVSNGLKNKDFITYLKNVGMDYKKLLIKNKDYGKQLEKFENNIEKYGEDTYKRGKKVIVEGVQLLDDTIRPDKSYFNDKPFILLNTNILTSTYRANKRDDKKFNVYDITNRLNQQKGMRNIKKANYLKHILSNIE